jgi:hypothetical protein
MAQNERRWTLDPEIESSYEAIGRSVVESALATATETGTNGNEVEATVRIRLTLGASGTTERMAQVCCVCSIEGPDGDTIIICRGPCCPGF